MPGKLVHTYCNCYECSREGCCLFLNEFDLHTNSYFMHWLPVPVTQKCNALMAFPGGK